MPAANAVEFARLLLSAERMLARDRGTGARTIGADPIFQHVSALGRLLPSEPSYRASLGVSLQVDRPRGLGGARGPSPAAISPMV